LEEVIIDLLRKSTREKTLKFRNFSRVYISAMSVRSLTNPEAGAALLSVSVRSVKSNKQTFSISHGPFVATPPTPIPDGMEAGFLYDPADASFQPTTVNFYWFLQGGVLGTTTAQIRSANNLTTYASSVLDVNAPVYPTPLAILLPFPSTKAALKIVIQTDATSNTTVIPLSLELL